METHETVEQAPEVTERLVERMVNVREQLRKIPEDSFIAGAAASVAFSLVLRALKRHHDAQFVGQWAPTLLLLGLYAKRRRELRTGEQPCSQGLKGESELH